MMHDVQRMPVRISVAKNCHSGTGALLHLFAVHMNIPLDLFTVLWYKILCKINVCNEY